MTEEKIIEKIAKHDQKLISHDKLIDTLLSDVKEIKEKLLGRPSWIVMAIITGLASLSSALIVYLLTK